MSGRVPPSSRAGKTRRSARGLSQRADVRRAADLFERFSGHEVESVDRVTVPPMPAVAVAVGELDGVLYTTVRDGKVERYIHKFRAADRPILACAPDGSALFILGGRYRFTELGIVDESDEKHRNAR